MRSMTLAEFAAFARGFSRFHGGEDEDAPTIDDLRQAMAAEAIRKAAEGL